MMSCKELHDQRCRIAAFTLASTHFTCKQLIIILLGFKIDNEIQLRALENFLVYFGLR